MKKVFFSIAILFGLLTISCRSKVSPNEWMVSTATCWNTMTVSKAGDYVPRLYTTCDQALRLPATEMAAEIKCETKFDNRVAGSINMTYQWRITDPKLFIANAKSVTTASTDTDFRLDPNVMEGVENAVVDKIIIDILRQYTPSLPAGVDELEIEKQLEKLVKTQIEERGIEFSNISLNVNFSAQTEEALDVISALEFYKAKGEETLGREVIKAKAGSASIVTNK